MRNTTRRRKNCTKKKPAFSAPVIEQLEQRLLFSAVVPTVDVPQAFNTSPALFIENDGQWANNDVKYLLQGSSSDIAVTNSGLDVVLFQKSTAGDGTVSTLVDNITVSFAGANASAPQGQDQAQALFNYNIGSPDQWRQNVSSYESVKYAGLYEGIDMVIQGMSGGFKYEFDVAAGADYSKIQVSLAGIVGLSIDDSGAMHIATANGEIVDAAPVIYQDIGGQRQAVEGRYVLLGDNTYGFEITGQYDATHELIIDPQVTWSTYLGGGNNDKVNAVTTDSSGNVYVVGETDSGGWVTGGAGGYGCVFSGNSDAFVAKFSSSGSLLWSSYLGGNDTDFATCVAVSSSGDVAVGGVTRSMGWVYGGHDTTIINAPSTDGFVVKLNSSGGFYWSTYVGGMDNDSIYGICYDPGEHIVVTGESSSPDAWIADWMSISGHVKGGSDGFIIRMESNGDADRGVFFGGNGRDAGYAIAYDSLCHGYCITGYTTNNSWINPRNSSGNQNAIVIFCDAYNMDFAPGVYCLGNDNSTFGSSIAVDGSGNVIVAGSTTAINETIVYTQGAGSQKSFVAKFAPDMFTPSLLWTRLICETGSGSFSPNINSIAVDSTNNIYLSTITNTSGLASGGFDTTLNGGCDTFLEKIDPNGGQLWSSYVGGWDHDFSGGLAIDSSGNVYLGGTTYSSGWVYGGYDTSFNGTNDGYLAKITNAAPTLASINTLTGATEDTPFEITYSDLAAAANEADADGDAISFRVESVSTGTLQKWDGSAWQAIVPGTTLLSSGEKFRWTPAANANGTLSAFIVKAWDGDLASAMSAMVRVNVSAVNDTPTLTAISNLSGAKQNTPFVITCSDLAAAADEADADGESLSFRIEAVSTGTLEKWDGSAWQAVTAGSTLLSTGEQLRWTPNADAIGVLNAFTVKAWDGVIASTTAVQVKVTVLPPHISWSTFLGGSDNDQINAVTTDSSGNVYVVGETHSIGWVSSGYDTFYSGNGDGFVAKFAPDGTLLWSSYLGGDSYDSATCIAVSSSGDVAVGGVTCSSGWVSGGVDTTYHGGSEGFVVKLNSSGLLDWSTYVGADARVTIYGICFGSGGEVAITGESLSASPWINAGWGGYPYQSTGGSDGFVLEISADGKSSEGGGLFGGTGDDAGYAIAYNPVYGDYFITGYTTDTDWLIPGNSSGSQNAIIVLYRPDMMGLLAGIYALGNDDSTFGSSIAVDASGDILVAGSTTAINETTVYTQGSGTQKSFVTKFSGSTFLPIWTRLIAGTGSSSFSPNINSVTVDSTNNIYLSTITNTPGLASGGFDTSYNGLNDGFLEKIDPNGRQIWSSYVGGTNDETSGGLAVDSSGNIYVGGMTYSSDWVYGGYDASFNGACDGYLVKITNVAPTLTSIGTFTGATEDTPFEITYSNLAAAGNQNDADHDAISFRIEAISTGTLEKWNGSAWQAVVTGTTLLSSGGKLRWTPAANANGTLNAFTVKAWDGDRASATAVQVQVNVSAVNDVPTLTTISTLSGATEDTPFEITYGDLAAAGNQNDVDGDALSFRVEAVSTGTLEKWNGSAWQAVVPGTTMLSTGEKLRWTPASNANGTLNAFTVKTWDGVLASATAIQVQVNVTAVNDAPTLTTISTISNCRIGFPTTITYDTLASAANEADVDGDTLSFRIEGVTAGTLEKWDGGAWQAVVSGSTLVSSGEQLRWTPPANATGVQDAFTVRAWDGLAASNTAVQVKMDLSAANQAPVLAAIAGQTMSHNQDMISFLMSVTDPDGDPITYTATLAPADNAYTIKTQYGLTTYQSQWDNYSGLHEKYISGANGINYQIRTDGKIYRNTDGYTQSIAQVDVQYYTNPLSLINVAQIAAPTADQVSLSIVGNRLTINPAADYLGSFTVNVTASDGIASSTRSFKTSVVNIAPTLTVTDQTMSHNQNLLILSMSRFDAELDTISYSATLAVADNAYAVKTQYGLSSYLSQWDNYSGLHEKYIAGANGINYQIRSDGKIYRNSDGYSQSVAQVAVQYYTNPLLLINAVQSNPPDWNQVNLVATDSQLIIQPMPGYIGEFAVNLTASDGIDSVTKTFKVNVTNTAPTLTVVDQTMLHNQPNLVLTFPTNDADGDTITYSATLSSADNAYTVKTQYGLTSYIAQWDNYSGLNEKYIAGANGINYQIRSDGRIYRNSDGYAQSIAQVAVQYYTNPLLLINAVQSTPPDPSQVNLMVAGSQLIIDPASNYSGQFVVNLTASDGMASVTKSFTVNVTNTAPTLTVADQTMLHNQPNLILMFPTNDADGDMLNYSATLSSADNGYTVKTQYGLTTYQSQWDNYSGLHEKYISGANGINYQIRSDGKIYRNSDGYTQSIAQVAVQYYTNPLSLINAVQPLPPDPSQVNLMVAGSQLIIDPASSYAGQFVVNLTVSDGVASVTKSFTVNVTNTAPTLTVADQTMPQSQPNLILMFPTTDADGDMLNYSATLSSADNGYAIKTQYGLTTYQSQWDNYCGLHEKYISGAGGINYQIRSDGKIYRNSDGYTQSIAQVPVQYYTNPLSLINAVQPLPPDPSQVNLMVAGSQLIIDPASNYSGQFVVNLTASDGVASITKSFNVTVTNASDLFAA